MIKVIYETIITTGLLSIAFVVLCYMLNDLIKKIYEKQKKQKE
jgi:hypothetical protein